MKGYDSSCATVSYLRPFHHYLHPPHSPSAHSTSLRDRPVDEDPNDDYGYRPVTALFTHASNSVLDLTFTDGSHLGVTHQHPIYSVTAGDWRLAGALQPGETVLTHQGTTTVASISPRNGAETVYNLEVKEWHNFLVGDVRVVVHNGCFDDIMKAFSLDVQDLMRLTSSSRVYKAGPTSKFNQNEADFFEELAAKLDDEIVMPDKNLASVIDGFSKRDGKRYELKVMTPGGNLGTKVDNFIKDIKKKRRSLENDGRFPQTNVYGKLDGHSRSDIINRWNDLKHKLGEKGEYLDEIFIYTDGELINLN